MDGSGSDVGVQETTMAFLQNDTEVTLIDEPSSSSNNNNRLSMFRTKFGFLVGRNFAPCAFRRWANVDDTIDDSSFSRSLVRMVIHFSTICLMSYSCLFSGMFLEMFITELFFYYREHEKKLVFCLLHVM
uniref:Transmembrane protein n=1 Tax=Medicago truncatula TaxID=3880 RepID=I3SSS3_MEDTR|nr:unknown [Medicago truncatula]